MYFCFSLWRKEGHRICWVVSGPGKSLGRTFAIIVLHLLEMPNALGIFYPECFCTFGGGSFLFPKVSEMSNTRGIISHGILQQRWGNVLAFQTYLQCQGSSEELYMGSRVHHKKD